MEGSPRPAALDAVLADVRQSFLDGRPLLDGRTILLTGAAGGIGKAVAEAIVCAGATLCATDIQQKPLDEVVGTLQNQARGAASGHAFDATDFSAFAGFADSCIEEHGKIDGLVNCAGYWSAAPHDQVGPDQWHRMLDLNLSTVFSGCQAVLPQMRKQQRGAVVNFASTAGEFGSISPGAHYAAAKGGVIALTKSLAREVGEFNVRVNAISPGPTDTFALGADTDEKKKTAGQRTLFGRLGRPEEIAYGCVFLLSDLSTFMTGQLLGVNGGSRL